MIKLQHLLELPILKDFKIICGESYLQNPVSSAVILEYESIHNLCAGFKPGQFVLASFFFSQSNPELVHDTLYYLIQRKVSAIAIKIQPGTELPNNLIYLAEVSHVPLLTFYDGFMEDFILDINRVLENRDLYTFQENLLLSVINPSDNCSFIRDTALKIWPGFFDYVTVAYVTLNNTKKNTLRDLDLSSYIEEVTDILNTQTDSHSYSFFKLNHALLFIYTYPSPDTRTSYIHFSIYLRKILSNSSISLDMFHIGICDQSILLKDLDKGIQRAYDANIICHFLKRQEMTYSELGLYKYIMVLMKDPAIYSEYKSAIRILKEYDEQNNSNLLDTLICLMQNQNDYPKTAKEMFQHINTIRYRIKKAKQLLNLPAKGEDLILSSIITFYLIEQYKKV